MRDGVPRIFASRAARNRALAVLAVAALGLVGSVVAVRAVAPFLVDPHWVTEQLRSFGRFAPLAYVALQAAQVVLAPIPGQVLGGVGGYLFGWVAGTVYSLLGVAVGSYVLFVLARRFGRPAVESWLAPHPLESFDAFVEEYGQVGLFLAFLFPAFPDDALCALAGLTPLRSRRLVALVLVGRLPSFVAVAYAGDSLESGELLVFGGVTALLGLATVVAYRRRASLVDAIDGLVGA